MFRLLPSEVAYEEGKATVQSYINNLHPHGNEDLYSAIEHVITSSIPIWIEALVSTLFHATHRLKYSSSNGWIRRSKLVQSNRLEDSKGVARTEEGGGGTSLQAVDDNGPDYSEGDDWEHLYEIEVPHAKKYKTRHRVCQNILGALQQDILRQEDDVMLEITEEQAIKGQEAIDVASRQIRETFEKDGVQVIVKLSNIHLTPEQPTYEGENWYAEGHWNENIVASALYYYDSENVTDSYLGFRQAFAEHEVSWDEGRYQSVEEIYGLQEDADEAIQVLGRIKTSENRLLVAPNVLQHRVSPFRLQDSTRPGHRKLLAVYLVDPFNTIESTANVPPQQADWWRTAVEESSGLAQRLPAELTDQIFDSVEDFPISLDEAKRVREEMAALREEHVASMLTDHMAFCFQ